MSEKPQSMLMLKENATVTICHSKTQNLPLVVHMADIVVAAVGKPKFITEDMIKEGAVVIDVGINRMADGKLCGDVDFDHVEKKGCLYNTCTWRSRPYDHYHVASKYADGSKR